MTKRPSAWTDPPAASLRIIVDEQGLTSQDKQAAWTGLTDRQASAFQRLVAQFMHDHLPPDIHWSAACFIATNRPQDDHRSIDFLSSSNIHWDPVELIEDWLDHQADDDE